MFLEQTGVFRPHRREARGGLFGKIGDHSVPRNKSSTCRIIVFAGLIGLKSIFVDHQDRRGPAWDEALAADRPVVLEVKTDPEVPRCRRTSRCSRPGPKP